MQKLLYGLGIGLCSLIIPLITFGQFGDVNSGQQLFYTDSSTSPYALNCVFGNSNCDIGSSGSPFNAGYFSTIGGGLTDQQITFGDASGNFAQSANLKFDDTGKLWTLGATDADTQMLLPLSNDAATPTLSFGDGDSGFYESVDDDLNLSIGGTALFQAQTNGIIFTTGSFRAQIRNVNPTATSPAYAFSADTDTGIGRADADQLSLIAGGKEMLRLVETGTATTDQIIIAPAGIIGTVATPALAFGDGDTGFWENSDDSLSFSLAGVQKWVWETDGDFKSPTSGAVFLRNAVGAVATPTYTFNADEDTGMASVTADQVSIIAGGVEIIRAVEDTTDYALFQVGTAFTPSGDQSLSAATQITVTNRIMRVVGNGGAVVLTGTPTIVDSVDGMTVTIQGTDDTNTITLQDEAQLANTGLQLPGAQDCVLGEGDNITLMYDLGDDKWYAASECNNN
jgi:hypothetical protein